MPCGSSMERRPGVLVVDDDESNRETMLALFEELPYHVKEASNSVRTLDVLRASPFRMVVVLDLLLPNVEDGWGVLHAVHNEPQLRRHAVVAITASPRKVTPPIEQLLSDLSAPLILKPFDIETLLVAVHQAAERCTDDSAPA